jgi:hypothetical protein
VDKTAGDRPQQAIDRINGSFAGRIARPSSVRTSRTSTLAPCEARRRPAQHGHGARAKRRHLERGHCVPVERDTVARARVVQLAEPEAADRAGRTKLVSICCGNRAPRAWLEPCNGVVRTVSPARTRGRRASTLRTEPCAMTDLLIAALTVGLYAGTALLVRLFDRM